MYPTVAFEAYLLSLKIAQNTVVSYVRDVRQFLEHFNIETVEQIAKITTKDIEKYLRSYLTAGKSEGTLQRAKASVSKFYTFLISVGGCDTNPTKSVNFATPVRKAPKMITIAEVNKLLNRPVNDDFKSVRDKTILELIYATGMRASEIIELDVLDINLDAGFVRIRAEKGDRFIPIHARAIEIMSIYLENFRQLVSKTEEKALFVNTAGGRLTRQGFWKIVVSYAEAAGISTEITPQILRHSFAYHLAQNGANAQLLSDILGYSSTGASQVYFKLLKSNLGDRLLQFHPRA